MPGMTLMQDDTDLSLEVHLDEPLFNEENPADDLNKERVLDNDLEMKSTYDLWKTWERSARITSVMNGVLSVCLFTTSLDADERLHDVTLAGTATACVFVLATSVCQLTILKQLPESSDQHDKVWNQVRVFWYSLLWACSFFDALGAPSNEDMFKQQCVSSVSVFIMMLDAFFFKPDNTAVKVCQRSFLFFMLTGTAWAIKQNRVGLRSFEESDLGPFSGFPAVATGIASVFYLAMALFQLMKGTTLIDMSIDFKRLNEQLLAASCQSTRASHSVVSSLADLTDEVSMLHAPSNENSAAEERLCITNFDQRHTLDCLRTEKEVEQGVLSLLHADTFMDNRSLSESALMDGGAVLK